MYTCMCACVCACVYVYMDGCVPVCKKESSSKRVFLNIAEWYVHQSDPLSIRFAKIYFISLDLLLFSLSLSLYLHLFSPLPLPLSSSLFSLPISSIKHICSLLHINSLTFIFSTYFTYLIDFLWFLLFFRYNFCDKELNYDKINQKDFQ